MEPTDTQKISDLKFDPRNPRNISPHDFEALKKSIKRFGDLSCIVKNVTTGELVGGHQRIRALMASGEGTIVITERFEQPTTKGTVAIGYVQLEGEDEHFKYREVEWSPEFQHAANIAANRIQGEFNLDLLAELTYELQQFDPDLLDLTGQTKDEIDSLLKSVGAVEEEDDLYTKKVEAPTYDPSEEKPDLKQLINNDRTKKLLAEIDTAPIPEDEKEFLKLAAMRHIVFDYAKIADYYAHSGPEVQQLMENSALVIIDFNKAIENGYVKVTQEIMDIQAQEYNEA